MDKEIVLKAGLYGFALFMTPFADKIIPILFADKWPSAPMIIGCAILGSIASSIGLRAYFDGSYERGKINNGNGNGAPAAVPAKPVVPTKTP